MHAAWLPALSPVPCAACRSTLVTVARNTTQHNTQHTATHTTTAHYTHHRPGLSKEDAMTQYIAAVKAALEKYAKPAAAPA